MVASPKVLSVVSLKVETPLTDKVPSVAVANTPVFPAPTFNCSVTVAVVALIVSPETVPKISIS